MGARSPSHCRNWEMEVSSRKGKERDLFITITSLAVKDKFDRYLPDLNCSIHLRSFWHILITLSNDLLLEINLF